LLRAKAADTRLAGFFRKARCDCGERVATGVCLFCREFADDALARVPDGAMATEFFVALVLCFWSAS
jgi:hypothetical protein